MEEILMTTFIILAVVWVILSMLVVLFASMASARFSRVEEEPMEARRRTHLQREPQSVPTAPNLGRNSVQN
jgi:hypothetical protein